MKKILSLMVLLAGVISFTSCGDDDATYQAAGEYIGGLIDEYIALIQK